MQIPTQLFPFPFLRSIWIVDTARLQKSLGVAVPSANNLTLGMDGNTFHITGTTQINLIDSTNWQAGSEINLIFDGALTVKQNQSASGNFKPILLQSGLDLITVAGTVTKFVFDGISWYQI